ncbi:xanthine dehydrogenase family protein molybdopterin-binding subunit [Scleromatobacter humisilvae]|uniref:Xanthine dehydrogenase family protein molybdopterin-binding subunit n=1 Tax=Scleromatobacter humisilvae TaxID=2897159 RepID=A0A9X1YE80_9BURK|nr:xanthine dehydrogenase family protein molybdopterin-binding subunit [Scleromatobacter humisilvae]MCK9684236.1 xanthine dehydrogenase family protein molybdopterin-binding subunit [Scleromatobacter humisilvae]
MHPLMQAFRDAQPDGAGDLALVAPGREPAPARTGVTRRDVLAAGGLVVAIGGWLPSAASAAAAGQAREGDAAKAVFEPNQFVSIGSDNLVTIVNKHHEMGQGNTTGLATLVADELDADWSLVRTEYAGANIKLYANLAFGMQGTGGSSAIANSYLQYRTAGATARAMLVSAAAQAWGVPASEIRTSDSVLTHASGKRATYGEMAAAAAKITPPKNPELKTPDRFSLMGKEHATPRVDSPSKCNGTATYTGDVKLPGLLTAVIAFPPSFGAKMVSFDAGAAKKVPGVTDVVAVPEGVAVVAKNTWAAQQGRRALKVTWDESAGAQLDSEALLAHYRELASQPGTPFAKPAPVAAPTVAKSVEAVYEFPFLAHAPMEPQSCVAWLHDGMLETWAGHQFPTFDHKLAAQAAGLPMEKVKLHSLVSGGSFGRRANAWSDFTVAAVNVAVAIKGRAPVRLQYTREDDMSAGLYRPMTVHSVKVGLSDAGKVAAWKHTVVTQSIVAGTAMAMMIKDGIDPTSAEGVSPTVYELPMMDGQLHSPALPVRPLWWRSVGNTHTAYVMETMMDKLAQAAGQDPLAFRLALLDKNPRATGALKLVAEKSGWGKAMPAGSAQGIAVHECFGTTVAQVAEVTLKDGKVRVDRVFCAVDCGVAVNPDVIRAQMEGCIGFALGALYYSEIELKAGRPVQRNFDQYKALRIYEMPAVEVFIVPSTAAPTGVGEPGVPPLGPAVANAIVRAGGPGVTRLPFARAGLVSA